MLQGHPSAQALALVVPATPTTALVLVTWQHVGSDDDCGCDDKSRRHGACTHLGVGPGGVALLGSLWSVGTTWGGGANLVGACNGFS